MEVTPRCKSMKSLQSGIYFRLPTSHSMDGDDEVSSARRHSASVTTETPPRSPTLVVTCPGSAFPLPAPATQQDSMHRALMMILA